MRPLPTSYTPPTFANLAISVTGQSPEAIRQLQMATLVTVWGTIGFVAMAGQGLKTAAGWFINGSTNDEPSRSRFQTLPCHSTKPSNSITIT